MPDGAQSKNLLNDNDNDKDDDNVNDNGNDHHFTNQKFHVDLFAPIEKLFKAFQADEIPPY